MTAVPSRHANGEVRRGRMSLSAAFGFAIGGLLVIAVGAVLVVSLWGAGTNTRALLSAPSTTPVRIA